MRATSFPFPSREPWLPICRELLRHSAAVAAWFTAVVTLAPAGEARAAEDAIPSARASDESLAPRPSARAEAQVGSLRQGAWAGAGLVTANGLAPSLSGGWQLQWRPSSWLYLRGGPGLSYTWSKESATGEYTFETGEIENTDEQRILAAALDVFLGLDIVGPLAFELGGTVGAASNAARTTVCGNETYLAAFAGLEGGFALSAGSRDQFVASVHGVAVALPVLRCTNSGLDPITADYPYPHMYHERDLETVGANLRFGYWF